MRVKLSRSAERDLREIRAFVAADSPVAADLVTGRLIKALLLIRAKPEIGRPGKSGAHREWSVPDLPYVIPYVVSAEEIYIIRIYHTHRLRPEEW
ncbi:MAG: type II toxin-antitoxin system RelE/ParE family toxin [Rhizobiaceae bacterium]|nr:type II toxin-antitoxin system RelE/ParE family toxin [Rhizobiaceae bacterium]